jgi:hypothetical protein
MRRSIRTGAFADGIPPAADTDVAELAIAFAKLGKLERAADLQEPRDLQGLEVLNNLLVLSKCEETESLSLRQFRINEIAENSA